MKGEITQACNLCTAEGRLNPDAVGWSRHPFHRCNLSGHRFRKKRWNYWGIQGERWFFGAGVCDLDYAATGFTYLVDLRRKTVLERSSVNLLGRHCLLGDRVDSTAAFRGRDVTFSESHLTGGEGVTNLLVTCARFEGEERLSAALRIEHPPGNEPLGVVVPFDHRRFQYTSKHLALPVSGRVRIGYRDFSFEGPECYATLDFGRGVWPRNTTWNWGVATGHTGDHLLALNLGGKWTDDTGSTENAVSVDGRLTKIHEDLDWQYDRSDFSRPWRVRAPRSGDVDLLFEPIVDRTARTNVLLVRSEVHQVFGVWSGTVRGEDGREIQVPYLLGWAEEHRARW